MTAAECVLEKSDMTLSTRLRKLPRSPELFHNFITICSVAQKHNVTSAAIIFKQFKGDNTEKLEEAKSFIDQAYNTESTSNDPKMWNYRAPIYLEIAQKYSELDKDAVLKATEAYLKCLQTDHKDRIIVKNIIFFIIIFFLREIYFYGFLITNTFE